MSIIDIWLLAATPLHWGVSLAAERAAGGHAKLNAYFDIEFAGSSD